MFSDEQFTTLLNTIDIFNVIGALAFPVFCFLLVEGFMHTHDVKKYFLNLLLFAVISEPIYDLANCGHLFSVDQQNVIFTLLLGLLAICIMKKSKNSLPVAVIAILMYFQKKFFSLFKTTDDSLVMNINIVFNIDDIILIIIISNDLNHIGTFFKI